MKTRILLFIMALLPWMSQIVSAQDEPESLVTGYCGEMPQQGMSMGANHEAIVTVRFDEDFSARFEGCRVTAIRVCMSGVIGATAGVWLTEDLPSVIPTQTDPNDVRTRDYYKAAQGKPEEFAYHFPMESWIKIPKSQTEKDAMAWQWVEMPLPEKYTIKRGCAFYAGFRSWPPIGGTSNAVVALSGGETDEHSWVYFHDSDDPWAQLLATNMAEFGVNLMIQVRLEGDHLPTNDIAMAAINGSDYLKVGEDYRYECVVQNMAANTIKSFDMTCYVDGKLVINNRHMEFPNGIKYKEYGGFVIDDICFYETGFHHIDVTVSNPNGVEDVLDGDNSLRRSVQVYNPADVVPRKVLVESFTGLTCGNCPAAHDREEEALEGTDAICVTHHSGFVDDPFTTPADKEYTWLFGAGGSTYAPAIMMDRTNVNTVTQIMDPGPVFYPGEPTGIRKVHDYLAEIPTMVSVDIDGAYNAETRELTVTVSGNVLAFPEGNDHRINVWLTESGIPSYKVKQAQTGSSLGMNYIHNHVMRSNLTPIWGAAVNLKGTTYSKTYTTTLNKDWEADNMEIVAFIGNTDGYDVNNNRVLNAEKCALKALTSGVKEVETVASPAVAYNLAGQRIDAPAKGVSIECHKGNNGTLVVRKVVK